MPETTQNSGATQSKYVQRKKHLPLTFKLINMVFGVFGFLFLAWLLSIVIEILGLFFFWPELGSLHSQQILKQELDYLSDDFQTSIIGSSPAVVAFDSALFIKYYVFEWTNLIQFYEWLKDAPQGSSDIRMTIARIAYAINDYFEAIINTTLIFAVRVSVATLSMPAFAFVGTAALVDGLVQRELRIYGGGIERAMVYHHVKPWIKPAVMTTWFVYLSIPISIHPNYIFVPAMIVFGLAIYLTAALFKKHA